MTSQKCFSVSSESISVLLNNADHDHYDNNILFYCSPTALFIIYLFTQTQNFPQTQCWREDAIELRLSQQQTLSDSSSGADAEHKQSFEQIKDKHSFALSEIKDLYKQECHT